MKSRLELWAILECNLMVEGRHFDKRNYDYRMCYGGTSNFTRTSWISALCGWQKWKFKLVSVATHFIDEWRFNSLGPGICGCDFETCHIDTYFSVWYIECSFEVWPLCQCNRTSFMKSQHWFRQWLGHLGAIRHQAIAWTNVDRIPSGYMTASGINKLTERGPNKHGS